MSYKIKNCNFKNCVNFQEGNCPYKEEFLRIDRNQPLCEKHKDKETVKKPEDK